MKGTKAATRGGGGQRERERETHTHTHVETVNIGVHMRYSCVFCCVFSFSLCRRHNNCSNLKLHVVKIEVINMVT